MLLQGSSDSTDGPQDASSKRDPSLPMHRRAEFSRWLQKRGRPALVKRRILSKHEQLMYRMMFDALDEDGSGTLEPEEIEVAFKALNIPMTVDECEELMVYAGFHDADHVNIDEFIHLMAVGTELLGQLGERLKQDLPQVCSAMGRRRLMNKLMYGKLADDHPEMIYEEKSLAKKLALLGKYKCDDMPEMVKQHPFLRSAFLRSINKSEAEFAAAVANQTVPEISRLQRSAALVAVQMQMLAEEKKTLVDRTKQTLLQSVAREKDDVVGKIHALDEHATQALVFGRGVVDKGHAMADDDERLGDSMNLTYGSHYGKLKPLHAIRRPFEEHEIIMKKLPFLPPCGSS